MTYNKTSLLEALTAIRNATSSRAALPILSNVLIDGDVVTATNLDLRYSRKVEDCGDIETMATTVPLATFANIVKQSASETIEVSNASTNMLQIKAGTARYKLATLSADEFPKEITPEPIKTLTVDMGLLKLRLAAVRHAASQDETRFALNGVCLELSGEPGAITTDGRRCAYAGTEASYSGLYVIIPNGSINAILSMGDGTAEMELTESSVIFKQPGARLETKKIQGSFPNWRQVLPSTQKHIAAECGTKELASAVSRAGIMSDDTIRLEFAQDELTISGTTADVGTASETISIRFPGKPLTIAIDPAFLAAALTAVGDSSEFVTLLVCDSDKPIILQSPTFSEVLMPKRTA